MLSCAHDMVFINTVAVVTCTRTEKDPPTKIVTHAEELLIVNSYLPEDVYFCIIYLLFMY